MAFDSKLRSPKEDSLVVLGVIFSASVWLFALLTIVPAIYALAFMLFVLIAQALFLAHVRGNGVKISDRQLPDIYERCKAVAARLGMDKVPEIYLLQSDGALNAFATKLLSRRYVIVNSALLDACDTPGELDFVIGHEMGHLAAGHLGRNVWLLPFRLLPWVGAAYSRACEYTADRCGLHCAGSLDPALRGIAILAGGGESSNRMDMQAFIAQRHETGGFWMAVYELLSSHPYLCKRAAALQELTKPGSTPAVGRNILAYPFAPIFGLAGGGGAGLVVIMVIGVGAAVAVPSFAKFQQQAQQAALANAMAEPDDPEAAQALAQLRAMQAEAGNEEAEPAQGGPAPGRGPLFGGVRVAAARADDAEAPAPSTRIISVRTATLGGNCGLTAGNATDHLAEACNGKALCRYTLPKAELPDGCRAGYEAEFTCGGEPRKVKLAPGAAGVAALSCF
jgi:Zn-dependent protease with chaperone function